MPAAHISTALCGLAIALAAVSPAFGAPLAPPLPASPAGANDGNNALVELPLPPGAVSAIYELANPPRLVLEWPLKYALARNVYTYPTGIVARLDIVTLGDRQRAVLSLRKSLGGSWRVSHVGDRMQLNLGGNLIAKPVTGSPKPQRTPRPNPIAYQPEVRITPVPVFRYQATPIPYPATSLGIIPTPTPEPTPTPIVVETPVPGPTPTIFEPDFSPLPMGPYVEPGVFGSRIYGGAEVPLSYTETYPLADTDITADAPLVGGIFGWDQMFTENIGISIGGRAISLTVDDAEAKASGTQVQHKRDDYEGRVGLRGRLVLGGGVELLVQPNVIVRTALVDSTSAAVAADATVGAPTAANGLASYRGSGWLGYGGGITGGLGWHVAGPLSLSLTGDYASLFAGNMSGLGVLSIFPATTFGGEAAARLNFGGFAITAGYGYRHLGHGSQTPGDALNQDWHGPTLWTGWAY